MPAMKIMSPYDTTPLKSGVFSGRFPPLQWTFFAGWAIVLSCARAADGTAAAAATAEACARKRLRFGFAMCHLQSDCAIPLRS
jgi:hypothetical protein